LLLPKDTSLEPFGANIDCTAFGSRELLLKNIKQNHNFKNFSEQLGENVSDFQ
jgi:hypothetical protein